MREEKINSRSILLQDLGVFLFMTSIIGGSLIVALEEKELLYQNVALLFGIFLVGLLIILRAKTAGIIVSSVIILVFTIYKLYMRLAYLKPIEWTAFIWPLLVIATLAGMTLFVSLLSTIEGVNSILNRRIDELTTIDPLTGLENLRSMVGSLKRYMALSERNGTFMGLMMVRLRYHEEIKKVLTTRQFNDLRHILAETIANVLRMEDRVFTIDENGSIAIIYFGEEKGVSVVKSRILHAVEKQNMLPDLNEQMLTVELSIVHRHYDKSYAKDALRYISDVEKEFAYEV